MRLDRLISEAGDSTPRTRRQEAVDLPDVDVGAVAELLRKQEANLRYTRDLLKSRPYARLAAMALVNTIYFAVELAGVLKQQAVMRMLQSAHEHARRFAVQFPED